MTAAPAAPHGAVQATEDKQTSEADQLSVGTCRRAIRGCRDTPPRRICGHNMPGIDLLASDRDNTHRVSVQVKTKGPNSRGWQTSTRQGLSSESADAVSFAGRYWVLVDLRPAPGFYVMPELWIRNDIYDRHQEYLAAHGGHRRDNPASEHHLITLARVSDWQDSWDVLGIDLMSSSSTRPSTAADFATGVHRQGRSKDPQLSHSLSDVATTVGGEGHHHGPLHQEGRRPGSLRGRRFDPCRRHPTD